MTPWVRGIEPSKSRLQIAQRGKPPTFFDLSPQVRVVRANFQRIEPILRKSSVCTRFLDSTSQLTKPIVMTALAHETQTVDPSLLGSLLTDDTFWPTEPRDLQETGLTESFIDSLLLKTISVGGTVSGRNCAERCGLPFRVIEPMLDVLRTRKLITHVKPAPFNDYYYSLTEEGVRRAHGFMQQCAYVGPAPVPLSDYVLSVEAQAAGLEPIDRDQLARALSKISHDEELLDQLGPAINSNTGLFLFGPPGNGKTTIARNLTRCLGQEIWIPNAILGRWQSDQAAGRCLPSASTGTGVKRPNPESSRLGSTLDPNSTSNGGRRR